MLSQIKIPVHRRNPIFEIENFIVSSQIFPKRQPDVVKPKLAFTLSPPTPVYGELLEYTIQGGCISNRDRFSIIQNFV